MSYSIRKVDESWVPDSLNGPDVLAIDTETTGLDQFAPDFRVLLVSWAFRPPFSPQGDPFCGPGGYGGKGPKGLTRADEAPIEGYVSDFGHTPQIVYDWVNNPKILKVGHNIKFDLKSLTKVGALTGLSNSGKFHLRDSRILWHLLDESSTDDGGTIAPTLQTLVLEYGFPYYEAPKDRLIQWLKETGRLRRGGSAWELMHATHPEALAGYAAMDAVAHLFLSEKLWAELTPEMQRHADFLMRAEEVLTQMELSGIKVDEVRMERALKDYKIRADSLAAQFQARTGVANLNSGDQVAEWAYGEGGCPVLSRTDKSKRPKADKDTFQRLVERNDVPEETRKSLTMLLEYRKLIKGTIEKIEMYRKEAHGGYIHSNFNLAGTRTGRLSSSPNVQNPTREGPLRSCFVSRFED